MVEPIPMKKELMDLLGKEKFQIWMTLSALSKTIMKWMPYGPKASQGIVN